MDADNQNPIRIINDGSCEYLMSRVMHTSCSTYATYYPFDTQTCNLVIAMWGYNEKEISIQIGNPAVSTDFYLENGEWEYMGEILFSKSAHFKVSNLFYYHFVFYTKLDETI